MDEGDRQGVQYSTNAGSFTLPGNWKLLTERLCDGGFSAERIDRFCEALDANGPVTVRPEIAEALANRTGISVSAAMFVLAGQHQVRNYHTGPIRPEYKAVLGLTKSDVLAAATLVPKDVHRDLLHLAMPADPAELWTTGPNIDAVAREWASRVTVPKQPVSEDPVVAAAKKPAHDHIWSARLVDEIAGMDTSSWLTGSGKDPYPLVQALLFFGYHLPVGSPARQRLPAMLADAREAARHPDLLLSLGYLGPAKQRAKNLLKLLNQPANATGEWDVNPWLRLKESISGGLYVHIRPHGYRDEDFTTLVAVLSMYPDTYPGFNYRATVGLLLIRDERLDAVCAQQAPAGADPDAYFQDPMVCVPDLVAEVAAKHSLDQDVAVLYLQLLGLPDPTDANVARWLKWAPTRLKAARARLAETDLVVVAKRAKARRKMFIPGEWADFWFTQPMEYNKKWMLRDTDGPVPLYAEGPLGTVEWAFRRAWELA
jgi:hypothetical protein